MTRNGPSLTRRAGAGPAGPPPRLATFALADQFDREIDDGTYEGAAVIIVVGNREGAGGVALWTAALGDALGDEADVAVLPVADLRGVPRMVRGMVARLLPRDPAHWCALDWTGQLGAGIRGEHGPLVAATYGTDRRLRTWAALPLDTVESALLVALVKSAFD